LTQSDPYFKLIQDDRQTAAYSAGEGQLALPAQGFFRQKSNGRSFGVIVNPKIFIAYSSKDQEVARTICTALENRGLACWISLRNIKAGENYGEQILKAIRAAKIMVLVFTTHANNSKEIKKELALANQNNLVVIPVRIEDVTPNEVFAYEFATQQWIDFFDDWENSIARLVELIVKTIDVRATAVTSIERKMFKWDIFLSHAGEDRERASQISSFIKSEFLKKKRGVSVFNTSEPETRFNNFLRTKPGERITSKWDQAALREYLRNNMTASRSYLLLVTLRSVAKRSEWIAFEIETAQELAQQHAIYFFPCVCDGASALQLPEGAWMFQSCNIASQSGLIELIRAMQHLWNFQ
jgi:hypothetical protein